MTLKRIAEMAGTSVSSVSKAFAGSKEIGEETKEKIFRIAKDSGCFDKYYKAPRKQPLIALMIPEVDSECYGNYASVFEREFTKRGADTIVACTRFDKAREERLFRELAYGMRVDGILLWSSARDIKNPDEIPLIIFSEKAPADANADAVKCDFYSSLLSLVNTVKDYGHTSVGFFGENLTLGKQRSFERAMRKVGLPIHSKFIVVSEKRFAEAGKECMKALMDGGELPSVIISAYDQIAYGAMKYAREHGIRIPEDISFVGMDDITATSYFDVPLSSIHMGYEEICEEVCDLVFARIENRHVRMKDKIEVPISVNIRESLSDLKKQ